MLGEYIIFHSLFLEIQLEKYNFRMLFVEIQLGRLSEASQTDFSTLNLNLSPLDGIDSRGARGFSAPAPQKSVRTPLHPGVQRGAAPQCTPGCSGVQTEIGVQ